MHIADALKRIVNTAVSHLHQNLLYGLAVVFGVHKLSGTKLLGLVKLCRVDVHADDPGCPGNLAAHYSSQADSSEAKHSAGRTGLDLIGWRNGNQTLGNNLANKFNTIFIKQSPCGERKNLKKKKKDYMQTGVNGTQDVKSTGSNFST